MNKNSQIYFSLSTLLLYITSALFCLTLIIFGSSGSTFDNLELIQLSIQSGVPNWHSPYYVMLVRSLNYIDHDLQFYLQLIIYTVSLSLVARNGPYKILHGVLFFLLVSPLTFYFFRQMGKDQLVTALFLCAVAGILNLIKENSKCKTVGFLLVGFALFMIILIRPNLGLFFFPVIAVLFANSVYRLHVFILFIFAMMGYFFYIFPSIFFHSINLMLREEYFLQYVFYSDLINLSIRDGFMKNGLEEVSALLGCGKVIYLDKIIELKAANTVNINGIWNIDNILNDTAFGVCRITTPEIYETLRKNWLIEVMGNPLAYFEIRLSGFIQFFYHETNTLIGKIASIFYSPIWLAILTCYLAFLKHNCTSKAIFYGMSTGMGLYLSSLFVLAPGYDLRYCLPISLGSIMILMLSRRS